MTFGAEYAAAVESKQVAAQDAERAKFIVEKVYKIVNVLIINIRLGYYHDRPLNSCWWSAYWLS